MNPTLLARPPGIRATVGAVLLALVSASAQEVVVDRVAYENNPPYPEAQNPQLPIEI